MAERRLLERTLSNGVRVRLVLEPLEDGRVRILSYHRHFTRTTAFIERREWEGRIERSEVLIPHGRMEDLPLVASDR